MAETYSLGVAGINAGSEFTPQVITIGDSQATAGGQAYNTRLGTQVLCKNPDGSKSWYMVDAERTQLYTAPILKPV